MIIEEAFEEFIKYLKVNGRTSDVDLMCKDFINQTQLVDISNTFDLTLDTKDFDIKNVCNPFKYTFIKSSLTHKTHLMNNDTEAFLFLMDSGSPCKYHSGLLFFNNNTIVSDFNFDIIQEKNSVSIISAKPINDVFNMNLESRLKSAIKGILNTLEKISYSTHDLYKTSSRKMVFKNRAKKEKIKVEKPIYIYLNKKDSEIKVKSMSDYKCRNIERLFSWNVRGHWRRLDDPRKRGKNSEGKYIVEGYTWVKPHICGNKDLPPKQQTYIVIDKNKELLNGTNP